MAKQFAFNALTSSFDLVSLVTINATPNGLSIDANQVLSLALASTSTTGALSSADWNTFNGKQPAGNYITALTGDGTASGPGSAALTLTTVNSNVGTFGSASHSAVFTVNAKGLITAASDINIQIAESQVTNLVTDLAAKQSTTLTSAHVLVGNVSNVATDVAVTGDVTISNAGITAIGTNKVANSQLAQMAQHTFKGNNTGSTANALDLTATQLTAELNVFTSTLKGLVPLSGGGTTTFLRADGTFATPPTGSGFGNWTSYSPTVQGLGATSIVGLYRTAGQNIECKVSWTNGTVNGTTASISLPSGFTVNATNCTFNNILGNPGDAAGTWTHTTNAAEFGNIVLAPATDVNNVFFGTSTTGTGKLVGQAGNAIMSSSNPVFAQFTVPV